jgi:hypothetical protein
MAMTMNSRKTIVRISVFTAVLVAVLFIFILVRLFGPLDPFPRMYKSAESPDGSLKVELYRKKSGWLCLTQCIDVLAQVHDNRQNLLFEDRIAHIYMWDEADNGSYSEVLFRDDEILVGPNYHGGKYYGNGFYYVIRKDKFVKK